MTFPYEDIINHPRHVSRSRTPMPMRDRAAQFSPFAALVGYEEAVAEAARLTAERREPDEQALAELNRKIHALEARLSEHPGVTIEYFVPDARKDGGAYVTVSGAVSEISFSGRSITMADGRIIRIADILSIEGTF